jgi:hypothetical protein
MRAGIVAAVLVACAPVSADPATYRIGLLCAGTMPLAVFMEHMKSRGVIDPQMTEADWQAGIDETMIDRPEPRGGETEDEDEVDEAA